MTVHVRPATEADLPAILAIYNQGIEDRIATLEADPKDLGYMARWFAEREARHVVLVADAGGEVAGWAAIAAYNGRCAYRGVGELSVYVRRDRRGQGLGQALLAALEAAASTHGFRKLVLFTFAFNALGQGLYRKMGYREVGVFRDQGVLDGRPVDVMAMEKLLVSKEVPMKQVLFACVHNTGRSQMAEAFFNRLADPAKARAISGGTEPATAMNATVVAAMNEVGIDLVADGHRPKIADLDGLAEGDRPISMGCGVVLACPARLGRMEDWGLDDPKGQPIERVRAIRDEIRRRVEALVDELGARRLRPGDGADLAR